MKPLSPHLNLETIRVCVTGRVQGVGFRHFTVRQAHNLGVTGWVRNLDDGSVEALLQGSPDAIDSMLSLLHTGPRFARVAEVFHEPAETGRRFEGFQQI